MLQTNKGLKKEWGKGYGERTKGRTLERDMPVDSGKGFLREKDGEMAREMTDGDWGKGLGSRLWEKGNANTREMTGGRSWGKD